MSSATIAVFDFDNTITDRHTFWRFVRFLIGPPRFWLGVLRHLPLLLRHWAGRASLEEMRAVFIADLLTGVPMDEIEVASQRFMIEVVRGWLRPEAMARLSWHQKQGHRTVLVSTSAEFCLNPWALVNQIDDVLATRFEVQDGRLTGRLVGPDCHGPEKVNRLSQLLGDLDNYKLYVYGDSEGDRQMLEVADHPFYRSFAGERRIGAAT